MLNSAKYAITMKEHFSFLARISWQNTVTVKNTNPPSPAKIQCALKGPGPLSASLCLTSLWLYRTCAPPLLRQREMFNDKIYVYSSSRLLPSLVSYKQMLRVLIMFGLYFSCRVYTYRLRGKRPQPSSCNIIA